MSKKKRKSQTPKSSYRPSGSHEVRQGVDIDVWKDFPVIFIFSKFDASGPWGIEATKEHSWEKIFEKIEGYQQMVWKELFSSRKLNHEIKVADLSKGAQTRLRELDLDTVTDTLLSLRVTGGFRLYGIRDRKECRLLWFDPWHDDENKAVCPSVKKHT